MTFCHVLSFMMLLNHSNLMVVGMFAAQGLVTPFSLAGNSSAPGQVTELRPVSLSLCLKSPSNGSKCVMGKAKTPQKWASVDLLRQPRCSHGRELKSTSVTSFCLFVFPSPPLQGSTIERRQSSFERSNAFVGILFGDHKIQHEQCSLNMNMNMNIKGWWLWEDRDEDRDLRLEDKKLTLAQLGQCCRSAFIPK